MYAHSFSYGKFREKEQSIKSIYEVDEEKKDKRPAIPEEVRVAVWRRDEGKCSKCGNREKLEYDYIIPVSKRWQ